mgnify:FL=1
MKKIVLVDGNNLLFRSYYATAYSGNIMRNKDGFPTNGIYGFVNMINKIIAEEKPEYMMVAFDIGKTFRHEKYADYKGGRNATPEDLKIQFPVAKKILTAMGIKYLECDGYEADDIIGTISMWCEKDDDYEALIVSSDKDLLQLISDETTVKLLKTKDYIWMDKKTFIDTYGFDPIHMIDLKALMGDSSDNIPGVKGIGEKGAIKLVSEYQTLDNIYDNINNIKGATQTKLIEGHESAYYSKDLVTIYREVPLDITFNDLVYKKEHTDELINIYNDLGFYSLLKKESITKENNNKELKVNIIDSLEEINNISITKPLGIYLELDNTNYHHANIIGLSLYNEEVSAYIPYEVLKQKPNFLTNGIKYTYDYKKILVSFNKYNLDIKDITFDTMIASYLLNYTIKDDIATLANDLSYDIEFYNKKKELTDIEFARNSILRAKFIYESYPELDKKLKEEEVYDLYSNIEFPLIKVLAKMEIEGIRVDAKILEDMKKEISIKIEEVEKDIYTLAGEEFNIASPKQLGEILFDKLKLPYAKKNKTGYVTDANVLGRLTNYEIVAKILEYRMLTKLYSTYLEGILNSISSDGKIHTIYTQALTRTGRLSSIEPNLQNIPARNEYGRLIRKAFVPEENSIILSSDYSQIELRVFAHLSNVKELVDAFNNNLDIHTKTAMDIFNVDMNDITPLMRRQAKAVNFGILYGISSYGLSEDLKISPSEAKKFMDKYFETYPGIKDYMQKLIDDAYLKGYSITLMNRRRNIEELKNTNHNIKSMGERMALNTPIQGTSADILKKAMIEIDNIFTKENIKSKMLLQVHDELIFNVYNDEIDKVKEIVKDTMENTYKLSVPLKVSINTGNNWYEAK